LPMAWEDFERKPRLARMPLAEILRLDPEHADPRIDEIKPSRLPGRTMIVCINGNESGDWREESRFLRAATIHRHPGWVLGPRGVRAAPPAIFAKAANYADPALRRRGKPRIQRVPRRQEPAGDEGGGRPGGNFATRGQSQA